MVGGFHVDDSTYSSCAVVGWCAAGLALQPIVGLLPQRRPWLGGSGFTRAAVGGEAVTPGTFMKPMPSWLDELVGASDPTLVNFDSTVARCFAQRWF
jgi:hypothetical protein